jgi:hypothetical protein
MTVTFVRPADDGGQEAVHRGLSYDDQLVSTSEPTVWPVP